MTSVKQEDYIHPNEHGNGPKNRMEGGDQTDDISINDPESLLRPTKLKKLSEENQEESQNGTDNESKKIINESSSS